jgi:hypothetical protein
MALLRLDRIRGEYDASLGTNGGNRYSRLCWRSSGTGSAGSVAEPLSCDSDARSPRTIPILQSRSYVLTFFGLSDGLITNHVATVCDVHSLAKW